MGRRINSKKADLLTPFLVVILLILLFFLYETQREISLMKERIARDMLENINQSDHVQVMQIGNLFLKDDFPDAESLHWMHMPVTYMIKNCSKEDLPENSRDFDYVVHTKLALAILSDISKGLVTFEETGEDADITIRCNISKFGVESESNEFEKVYIAGNTWLIYSENKIINASIDLFRPYRCSKNPITQIHELLHAFGFGHTPLGDEYVLDMMYPFQTSCNAKISPEVIDALNEAYS